MPTNQEQIKTNTPWKLKKGQEGTVRKTFIETNPGNNSVEAENQSRAVKEWTPDGTIVDVKTRNKSSVNERPAFGDKVNLSQKAGRGRNPASGGKTMGEFSQKKNHTLSRNAATASRTMDGLKAKISSGSTSVRKYPAKGANARGRNAG